MSKILANQLLAATFTSALLISAASCTKQVDEAKPIPPLPSQGANSPAKNTNVPNPHGEAPQANEAKANSAKMPAPQGGVIATKTGAKFDLPAGWTQEPPASSMRLAELVPPRAAGDTTDSRLIVTFFQGGAGPWEANLDRWAGQMKGPDGNSLTREKGTVSELKISSDRIIKFFDLSGTLVETPMPGVAGEARTTAGARMIVGAIDETGGSYYFKLTGPAKSVTEARTAFEGLLKSLRL